MATFKTILLTLIFEQSIMFFIDYYIMVHSYEVVSL